MRYISDSMIAFCKFATNQITKQLMYASYWPIKYKVSHFMLISVGGIMPSASIYPPINGLINTSIVCQLVVGYLQHQAMCKLVRGQYYLYDVSIKSRING